MPEAADDPTRGPVFDYPPGFAEAIAHIANNWAHLEFFVNYSVWILAQVDPATGACLTSQVYNLQGRIAALLSLLRLRNTDEVFIKRVNKFAERARVVGDKRNRVVHDLWLMDNRNPAAMARLEITAPKVLSLQAVPTSLDEITTVKSELVKLRKESWEIRSVIFRTAHDGGWLHPDLFSPLDRIA